MASNESRDLLRNRPVAAAVFWLPVAVLIASTFMPLDILWRTAIWVICLATMGVGCVVNALRCGRTHCYFTGPFFLLLALLALLFGLGIVSLGRSGWNVIALATLGGAILLCCLPETYLGRYKRGA
jgi:hypothetical protein